MQAIFVYLLSPYVLERLLYVNGFFDAAQSTHNFLGSFFYGKNVPPEFLSFHPDELHSIVKRFTA